jgi:hypothetical protein
MVVSGVQERFVTVKHTVELHVGHLVEYNTAHVMDIFRREQLDLLVVPGTPDIIV